MGIATANGRNLRPANLEKEVFIRFNLPPFHILKKKFIPLVAKKWREEKQKTFHRKHEKKVKAIALGISASLHNFRKNEEMCSHSPIEFFQKD